MLYRKIRSQQKDKVLRGVHEEERDKTKKRSVKSVKDILCESHYLQIFERKNKTGARIS